MNFLDKLMGRAGEPVENSEAGRTLVVPSERPFVNTYALDNAGLRRGMWVMSGAGLAIITGARLDGLAEITLQKPDGATRMELSEQDQAVAAVRVVDMTTLRAAHIEEIPDSRHEGEDHLRGFGYISASEA